MSRVRKVEVLVVGGGVTGAGIARDLAMRGTEVLLVERGDFSAGATGANHGMLHSGARYAVKDPVSARECAVESEVLRRIAAFCIEDTGGVFVSARNDDLGYRDVFLRACRDSGVPASEITTAEARASEPNLAGDIQAAVEVRDASVDPFFLTLGNIGSAREHGAEALNHCPLLSMTVRDGQAEAVIKRGSERTVVRPEVLVNAAGAWAGEVASMAGLMIPVSVDKGTLVVLNGRIVRRLVNRLRPPSDGDILVPHRTATILGTTSSAGRLDDIRATSEEVDALLQQAAAVVPGVRTARAVRAYAGVRPILGTAGGRGASRAFQVLDHRAEGVENMISVVGGKLTTYRLMAERTADAVQQMLGRKGACRTHLEEIRPEGTSKSRFTAQVLRLRHGSDADTILRSCGPHGDSGGCECEAVGREELEHFARSPDVRDISDLMRRTRAGMGYCQAGLCALRLAATLDMGMGEVSAYYRARWRGVEPVLRDHQLRQELFKAHLLRTYGLDHSKEGRK